MTQQLVLRQVSQVAKLSPHGAKSERLSPISDSSLSLVQCEEHTFIFYSVPNLFM